MIYVNVNVQICIYIYTCIYIYAYMHICIYAYMHIYIYTFIHIFTYIYIMFISVYIFLCPVYAQIGPCSGYLPVTWFPHHVFDQSSNQEPLGFRV